MLFPPYINIRKLQKGKINYKDPPGALHPPMRINNSNVNIVLDLILVNIWNIFQLFICEDYKPRCWIILKPPMVCQQLTCGESQGYGPKLTPAKQRPTGAWSAKWASVAPQRGKLGNPWCGFIRRPWWHTCPLFGRKHGTSGADFDASIVPSGELT